MVYPRPVAETFWNFADACKLDGARYSCRATWANYVAAMLPQTWDVRPVNRNTEDLTDNDLDWADLVMTEACYPAGRYAGSHQMCRTHNKPVVVGGPTQFEPAHLPFGGFPRAGRGRGIINEFITAWEGPSVSTSAPNRYRRDEEPNPAF